MSYICDTYLKEMSKKGLDSSGKNSFKDRLIRTYSYVYVTCDSC